ncbi:MAG: IS200/IS605 family transposase [Fuerstiella sp.]
MGSYTSFLYHFIFGTKFRRPCIKPAAQKRVYRYIGGTIRSHDGVLIQIGGMPDHVHILSRLPGKHAVSDVVRDIKASSSKWIGEEDLLPEWNGWQVGYGGFSVSHSDSAQVEAYIRNQAEHHRQKTFQEEYIEFLQKHEIKYDLEHLFEQEYHG